MDGTERSFWKSWVLACVVGEMIGIAAASFVMGTTTGIVGEPTESRARIIMLGASVLAGLAEGASLGFFEWRVLRRRYPGVTSGAWIGVTATVAALGWLAGMVPSIFAPAQAPPGGELGAAGQVAALTLALLVGGGMAGLVFGAAQWLVFRNHALRSGQWVIANVLAWPLALAWIFLGAMLPTGSTRPEVILLIGLVSGILAGVTYGTITGAFLLRILPLPSERAEEIEKRRAAA